MAHDRSFATWPLPPHQRVAGWTQAVSDRFVESGFEIGEPEGFDAAMLNRDLAALSLTRFRSSGHGHKRVTRSQRQAARGAEEFFLLSLQHVGAEGLGQRVDPPSPRQAQGRERALGRDAVGGTALVVGAPLGREPRPLGRRGRQRGAGQQQGGRDGAAPKTQGDGSGHVFLSMSALTNLADRRGRCSAAQTLSCLEVQLACLGMQAWGSRLQPRAAAGATPAPSACASKRCASAALSCTPSLA
jgi:hypothetical protein